MSGNVDALRDGIRLLLSSHPNLKRLDIETVKSSHTGYAERYVYAENGGIGHEACRKTQQNLWVKQSAVDINVLADIRHRTKPGYAKGEDPGRDSNLEQIPGFRFQPLYCFIPKTLEEADRVICAAAGARGVS